jgi:hypothetical protein
MWAVQLALSPSVNDFLWAHRALLLDFGLSRRKSGARRESLRPAG